MAQGTQKKSLRRWPLAALSALGATVAMPSMALASSGGAAPSVARYTLAAMAVVIVVAMVVLGGLMLAHRLHLIGADQRVIVSRRLRVGFGAAFLMALVSPYVALHFSVAAVMVFLGGFGLLVTLWAWSASEGDLSSRVDRV